MLKAAQEIAKGTMGATQTATDALMMIPKGVAGVAGGATGGLVGLAAMLFVRSDSLGDYFSPPAFGALVGGAGSVSAVGFVSKVVGTTVGAVLAIPTVLIGTPFVALRDTMAQQDERRAQAARQQAWEQRRQAQVQPQPQPQPIRLQARAPAASSSSSQYSYHNNQPTVLSETEQFLLIRSRYPNKQRIYQALFDKDLVNELEPPYDKVAEEFRLFLLNKIGNKETYEGYMHSVICPIEMDIPDDPVSIPTAINALGTIEGTHRDMVGYKLLVQGSPNFRWKRVTNPISRAEPYTGEIKPDYFAQQLIERIIHRCYQFREERDISLAMTDAEKAQAHARAVQRYYQYTAQQLSPSSRFNEALGDKGSYTDFMKYLTVGLENFVQTFGQHHEQIAALIMALSEMNTFPNMPVLYKGVLSEYNPATMTDTENVQISYDAQNLTELLIFLARDQGEKFAAWNKPQAQNQATYVL